MATITSTSTRITISGTYKDFTSDSGSTSTVIQFSAGDAPAPGDAGRFLLWQKGANTGDWEIRFIESATATTVTVTDGGFSSAPASGENFVISTNLDDIDGATSNSVMRSQGNAYQMMDRDFELASGAFLADVDKSLVTKATSASSFAGTYPLADGCALQFGRLIGGEANDSTETIGGCQIGFEVVSNNSLLFTRAGAATTTGPVINFYGCLLESTATGGALFIRSPGPMRVIGCVSDGPMGGRLYSPASELVDTRFSGNTSGGVAWSLGGTFTRAIDNVFFFQNNTSIKAYLGFQGVFSNTKFSDSNTNIIDSGSATSELLFSFIDCTTFADNKITANNGQFEQLKSINYTIADNSGTSIGGAKVAVFDNVGDEQGGGVQVSTSGIVPTINARFFRKDHGAAAVDKSPFSIRIRNYGKVYLDIQSSVAEPIKQEIRLTDNPNVVLSKSAAAALTGIDINFNTNTLTITEDHGAQNLYDYYQRQLEYDAKLAFAEEWVKAGDAFDLAAWNVVVDGCTYTGDMTTTGTITLSNGAIFNGTRTDVNGTVYPDQPISITNISAGSRLQIYNVTADTETVNTTVAGTSYTSSYQEGVDYTDGDTIRIRLTKLGKEEWTGTVIDTSAGFSALASQVDSDIYNAMGVDGSTVTKFQADYVNQEVDLIVAGDWTMAEVYAWWMYNLTTEGGIRNFFGGVTAIDEANFKINTSTVNLFLNNHTLASYKQTDNRRLFRDTVEPYPVRTPTASGYGLDVVWRNTILIAETPTSGLTASEADKLATIESLTKLIPATL